MIPAHVVILVAGFLFNPIHANPTARILGGDEAAKTGFTYTASVRNDGAHVCGGSIIGARTILTAAHCLSENGNNISANRLTVRVGSTNQFSGGKLYTVSETIVHPNYAGEKNNIAVLRLESPLEWSSRIEKIDIATDPKDDPAAGDSVKVAGWGEQSTNTVAPKLHSISLHVATEDVCLDAFSKKEDSDICLSHELKKGSCTGDAGNGAVYKNKLIGVSSFIVGACGSRYPDVFSKVTHYANWIKSVTV